MEKFIPFEKLSKKKQRLLNAQRRGSWGSLSPVTRRSKNPRAYNRKKARKWNGDSTSVPFINLAFRPGGGRSGFALVLAREDNALNQQEQADHGRHGDVGPPGFVQTQGRDDVF